jgi:hypothetical protein
MLTAPPGLRLFWKRVVAALSLLAAAALGPTAPAPVNGAGVNGSRTGNGAALANAANTLLGNVAALIEGGQHKVGADASSDSQGKAYVPPARYAIAVLRPGASSPPPKTSEPVRAHGPRSGLSRAPPPV